MSRGYRVGFCLSGSGRLFRAAVRHSDALGIAPMLVVIEPKASADLDAFCRIVACRPSASNRRIARRLMRRSHAFASTPSSIGSA